MQIASCLLDPLVASQPRLEYVLKGIKRVQAEKGVKSRPRLPITPRILRKMEAAWNSRSEEDDIKMVWAACCLSFFGFLRCGEMTVPSDSGFDPSTHLSVSDIQVDHPSSPSIIQVNIKASKTDPFRKGVQLYLGKTESDLCPVAAMVAYLCVRGMASGPLFVFKDGRYLTR